MVASRFVLTGFAAVACASAMANEEDVFAVLLKRQEPGTPAYNCHDNCGTAITVSRSSPDPCTDAVFLNDYKNCLQCAGPDNVNIWQYYGRTLGAAGQKCSLSTTPLTGKQPDVPVALHPGDAPPPASTSEAPPPSSSDVPPPSSSDVPPPSSSDVPPPSSSDAPPPSSSNVPTLAPTSSADTPPTGSETVVPTVTLTTASGPAPSTSASGTNAPSSSVSGSPTRGSNSTVTTTSPPLHTGAAASVDYNAGGLFGAVVMGIMYGLGN